MHDSRHLKRFFRIGCRRGSQYRPIASVGLSKDGGIMVAPVAVKSYGWSYGTSRTATASAPSDWITSPERPKLHYHSSGIASVTLTGHEIERKRLRLPPIQSISYGQVISIVAIRPWELQIGESRRGDVGTIHKVWPESVSFLFQLVHYTGTVPVRSQAAEIAPLGLPSGDDSRWFVDMSWYIPNTVLVALSATTAAQTKFLEPSVTVSALPWSPDRASAERDGVFALWSSNLRNPLVAHARARDLLTDEQLAERLQGQEFHVGSVREAAERIYGARRDQRDN